jgi:hypothetical protein
VPNPDAGSGLIPPVPMSKEGIVGVSAGLATGRAPASGPPLLRGGAAGLELDRAAGLRLELLRPLLAVRALLRLAGAFFLPPARDAEARLAVLRLAVLRLAVLRLAVLRLAVLRLVVDFLAVDRFAAVRLLVDFFVDFFFAAIDPPCMRDASRA